MRSIRRGWLNGFAGMLMFSGGLPATRLAMASMDPLFITSARGAIAGILAASLLVAWPHRRPGLADLPALAAVSLGCVIGYPLLTALALRGMTAADAIVFAGLLPLATAVSACLLGETRPRLPFWIFASTGSALIGLFAVLHGGRLHGASAALMVLAVLGCGLGYAAGARVARRMGGWQAISWALCLTLPISVPLTLMQHPDLAAIMQPGAAAGLLYVSVFTMLIGFMCWYDGLAHGGTAAVGQLQLLQPFIGLLGAAALLNEAIGWLPVLMLGALMACAAGARRFG